MEKSDKIKITNSNQFEKMVEELKSNPSLAVGFRRGTTPSNFKENWEEIAVKLNALGPPIRLGDGWQKVWRDLKFKVKKKLVANKAESNATGGGIYKQFSLSSLEESVANLMNFQKQLNPEGCVQGIPCQQKDVECEVDEIECALAYMENEEPEAAQSTIADLPLDDELPMCSTQRLHSTPKRSKLSSKDLKTKTTCNGRDKLLERHSNQQAKVLTEISNTLSSVKRCVKDMTKYHQNLMEIEKQKLKILQETNKREEELYNAELKIKKIKIIIKEKELEILEKSCNSTIPNNKTCDENPNKKN